MIVDNGKYYLYRFIRLDKNEPFYVGIGTKDKKKRGFESYKSEYHRAHYGHSGIIYDRIVNKTSYQLEIILESNDYNFIKEKETEFVKLYGRINNHTGTLANLTDGGEGTHGCIASEETRKKISENNATRGKFGKLHQSAKRIYQYDVEGNFIKMWDSGSDIKRAKEFNSTYAPHLKQKTFKGYMFKTEFLGDKIDKVDYSEGINKRIETVIVPIYQYSLSGKFLKKYNSISIAARELGGSTSGLGSAVDRKNNKYLNSLWYREYMGDNIESNAKPKPKIDQYDLNDNYIKTYNRQVDILREYNVGRHYYDDIRNVCIGKTKSSLGFKWKYNYES